MINSFWRKFLGPWLLASLALAPAVARAQAPAAPAGNENDLGEFVVTGHKEEKLPRIAILPSLSPDLEDVVTRSVVRRDIELTGLFELISDSKAPSGLYSFDDPVDVEAWQRLGAEAIVKVAARPKGNKAEMFGLAYFLNVGKDPVYQKKLTVDKADVRVTAHRLTDALLGALTGRPGGFASQFTFSSRWTKNQRVFRMDADGQSLTPLSDPAETGDLADLGSERRALLRGEPRLRAVFAGAADQRRPKAREHAVQDVDLRHGFQQGPLAARGGRRRKRQEHDLRRQPRRYEHDEGVHDRSRDSPDVQPVGQARLGRRRREPQLAAHLRGRQARVAGRLRRDLADLLRHGRRHPAGVRRVRRQ
jgi:hypothetical protein